MAKKAEPPFKDGFYLELNLSGEPHILWLRYIPDSPLWDFYNAKRWHPTLISDHFMLEKNLLEL